MVAKRKAADGDGFLAEIFGERRRKQNDDDGHAGAEHVDDAVEHVGDV